MDTSYVVITMRRYPRFVSRNLRHEYLSCMSPENPLFEDWLSAKRRFRDHNGAFKRSRFEERFAVGDEGLEHLARLAAMASKRDVHFVCQCQVGNRCHRELVLILARELFGARVENPKNDYPIFLRRVRAMKKARATRAPAKLSTKRLSKSL